MTKKFIIHDQAHAEWQGDYDSLEELKRRATIPWNESPNVCPCTSWRTCGRDYEIIEFDISVEPWIELRRLEILKVLAKGVIWSDDFKNSILVSCT